MTLGRIEVDLKGVLKHELKTIWKEMEWEQRIRGDVVGVIGRGKRADGHEPLSELARHRP